MSDSSNNTNEQLELGEEVSREDIEVLLNKIKAHVKENPRDEWPVIAELHSILNQYSPEFQKNKLSLLRPQFDQDKMLQKIRDILCPEVKIKIPDLRFKADEICKKYKIPLPNSTRKNCGALLQWYDIHWDKASEYLMETRT